MPFVSQAQRAKFYSDPALKKYIPEMEAATPKGKKLPKRVHPKGKPVAKKHFIQQAIQHPGALHQQMGVPQGQNIPQGRLRKAAHGGNTKEAERARFALLLAKLRQKKQG